MIRCTTFRTGNIRPWLDYRRDRMSHSMDQCLTWMRLLQSEQGRFSVDICVCWLTFFRLDGIVFVCLETLIGPLVIGMWKGGIRSKVCFLSVSHRMVRGKRAHGPMESISPRICNLNFKLNFFVLGRFKCFNRTDCSGFCQAHSN